MKWYKPSEMLPTDNTICNVIIQEKISNSKFFVPESLMTVYNSKKFYPWSIRKGRVIYWQKVTLPTDFITENIIIRNECIAI
jgi:hypothetical protein